MAASFDLDRSAAEAWTAFAERLGEVVSVMEPGATLTLSSHESELEEDEPFVRFSCDENYDILSEVSGNDVLGPEFQLCREQQVKLAELGWNPPNPDAEPAEPNYWRVAKQEYSQLIAEAAVAVLDEVFQIMHPAFLASDQLNEILNPAHGEPQAFSGDIAAAVMPSSQADLKNIVEQTLLCATDVTPMLTPDGEFAIRYGSSMVFIRATADAREVMVFSPIVHDVEGRTRAAELLMDLNVGARYVKFILLADRVFISISMMAHPFVPAHLLEALRLISQLADELDERLAETLRGETYFEGPGRG
ncbi:MAG: YbjN domain-containing protein [Propionibacteriaceae bacterium]|jgi:hypothetical protein|nr:YbjN domain-containing protein [Propionibacteriaceae bacterium]